MRTKNIPIIVSGGLDTKTNPKLLKPGAALQLDNMYQLKTGEWRARNGASPLSAGTYPITGITADMFPGLGGGLMANAKTWNGQPAPNVLVKRSSATQSFASGWIPGTGGAGGATGLLVNVGAYPRMTASVAGWMSGTTQQNGTDMFDPDLAFASGGIETMSATSFAGAALSNALLFYETRDPTTGTVVDLAQQNFGGTFVRPPVLVTGSITSAFTGQPLTGTSPFICRVRLDTTAAPYSLWVDTLYNGFAFTSTKVVNADVSAAQPWFDAMHVANRTGTYTPFIIAYRATGGGITLLTVNPATAAIDAGPLNVPGLTASMAIGFLVDDVFAQGDAYLATADAANGVRYTRISCAAGSVSVVGTNTIDAGATTGIRQITGYVVSANSVVVLWDVDASPTYKQTIHIGTFSGGATTQTLINTFGLYSRAFTAPDGQRYVVASYDSTAFPAYVVLNAIVPLAPQQPSVSGVIYPGYAGGRRVQTGTLASATLINGVVNVPIVKLQSFTTGSGTLTNQRQVGVAMLSWNAPLRRPRELGGTLFMPGGMVLKDDGALTTWATVPIPPESPGLAQSIGGGSLTAGATYFYRGVIKQTDAVGRVTRSAGSIPISITLGGGSDTVTAQFTITGLQYLGTPNGIMELYRAGPAAAGATNYNKVGETPFQASTGTLSIVDQMSDANAAAGELLYSTGNVLENTCPPSSNLMEVNGGRLWLVNAEDPTELWFSKVYVSRTGIGFNSTNTLRVQGDGTGGITALGAMDGRLIVFKRAAIYVISGSGPNDLGSGSFNDPQAISLVLGSVNPSSVLQTPDGILFQATNGGIWLLDRGLTLSYIGAPVETYTSGASVVDCSLVTAFPQARFVFGNGTCLVWDYHHKRWYVWTLFTGGSTVTACANTTAFGWCYSTADGKVYQEVAGQAFDNVSTSIIPVISLPHLDFAGLSGYQRLLALDFIFDVAGSFTVSVDAEYNYSGALTGTPRTKALTTATPTAQVEYNPPEGLSKNTSCRPVITVSGLPAGGTFRLTSATAWVRIKDGTNVPATSRLT